MTHYATLGVAESASPDEIKKAYRKLASQHHPDKGGDTAQFQEIQTAYDTLSDPSRREQYDHERQNPGQFRFSSADMAGMPAGMQDVFRNFGFNFGGAGHDPFGSMRQKRNRDLRIEIPISLEATLADHSRTVKVVTATKETTTVEVQIPRGVTNGTNIKYSGLGDNLFTSIPRGDLYVQISVLPNDKFHAQNIDLHTPIRVNCLLATVGGVTTITTLDQKVFELTIPAGTQPGTRFRIPKQGLYQLNSSQRGDLYVEMLVNVPQNLTPEQLELIRSITTQ